MKDVCKYSRVNEIILFHLKNTFLIMWTYLKEYEMLCIYFCKKFGCDIYGVTTARSWNILILNAKSFSFLFLVFLIKENGNQKIDHQNILPGANYCHCSSSSFLMCYNLHLQCPSL